MSLVTGATAVLALLAVALLWRQARGQQEKALTRRAHLLDEATKIFPDGKMTAGKDGFPTYSVRRDDGSSVVIALIADTLTTRRLPQLWLAVTLRDRQKRRSFSLGALARPTGAEFYALTHDLPDLIAPPPSEMSILMRARDLKNSIIDMSACALTRMLEDNTTKEVVVTPAGVRIVRQACQGDRGAHLILRQAHFELATVPESLIRIAVQDADRVGSLLVDHPEPALAA